MGTRDHGKDTPSYWRVQPLWVKFITIAVGLPAWLVLAFGVLTGRVDGDVEAVSFGLFLAVAILQLLFVSRAYWRMEL
jgi:hypothetical protein